MRLKITNSSKAKDSFVLPLIRFAAKHFSVSGRVTVLFRETNKPGTDYFAPNDPRRAAAQKLYDGYCQYRSRHINVRSTLNEAHPRLPCAVKTLGYFPGSKIAIAPYEYRTPEDIIVHVAAHEFAHLMPAGQKFRKSRIEVFCENKATEILNAFRTPEGQAWVAAERARLEAPAPVAPEPSEDEERAAEVAALEARLKSWGTKAKRAATAIKKITKKLARLAKKS